MPEEFGTIKPQEGTDNGFVMEGPEVYIHVGKFDVRIRQIEDAMDNGVQVQVYPYNQGGAEPLEDRTFYNSEADPRSEVHEMGDEDLEAELIMYDTDQMQVKPSQIKTLKEAEMVWYCDECECYHPTEGTLDKIRAYLKED